MIRNLDWNVRDLIKGKDFFLWRTVKKKREEKDKVLKNKKKKGDCI